MKSLGKKKSPQGNQSGEKQSNKLLEQKIKKPLKEGYGAASQRKRSS